MNEPTPPGRAPGPPPAADAPTPAQTALLQYLNVLPDEPLDQAGADAFIAQLEAAPDWQPHLQAWHRDKFQLHPELFATPQRSFRKARWWQSQIGDDNLYGYNFRQPSVKQTLVILESLDRRTPGWDQESEKRRTHRFMNELATLSPELCKPGCSFPHELPAEGDESEDAPVPAPAFRAPSAPFVPNTYAAASGPPPAVSKPTWNPPVQPPLQNAAAKAAPARGGGAGKWVLGLLLLAAGAGAYGYFGFRAADPARESTVQPSITAKGAVGNNHPPSAAAPTTVKALDSQRRAMEAYPDLAKAGSPLNKTFVAMVHQLEIEHSPRLQQPDWPEQVAAQCAKALLIKPAAGKSAPAAPAAPAPVNRPQAAAAPVNVPVAAVPLTALMAAVSTNAPTAGAAFVSMDAAYKEKLNTVKYHEHGAAQEATVQVDIHSMEHGASKWLLRCVFFKRPTGHGDRRSVLSTEEKHIEVAGGQPFSDTFASPQVYRGRGATEEFDGWLVQLFPEGSDKFVKQIGSTGTIEELGKKMKF